LGLSGVTNEQEFLRLCRNIHPQTGERLTQRLNGKRITVDGEGNTHESANRRVFYDFTLSPPKSVSIAALVADDRRIIEAHDTAVKLALEQLQSYAATRVRKQGQYSHRNTSNLLGAVFRHDTSRALDPHLHSHCILFNATKDKTENRWKALEPYEMLQAKKYTETVYYHELVRSLMKCGFRVQHKPRGDFEIEGVSQDLIDRFSKRHREIDEKTRELLTKKPEMATRNLQEIRANIAHKERARKIKDVGLNKLQSLWKKQLSFRERFQLHRLDRQPTPVSETWRVTPEQAVRWAEEHLFDRRSVVHEHEIWRHALEHARGQNFSFWDIQSATHGRGYVRDKQFQGKVTTREVIQREWDIVRLAQDGIRRYDALARNVRSTNMLLDAEQRQAVEHILSSRDFVILFRGGAGTGKSFTLREVHSALNRAGHVVQILAPQHQQVEDLQRSVGVAWTVSSFLTRSSMPRGTVVLVDEAGQIGGEQMLQLLLFVKKNRGRIILSGDTRQHGAVEATDALRAIEKYSGIESAELTNIRRQNPDSAKTPAERQWLEQYKLAVNEAREGKLAQSFDRLDKQGVIVPCTLADQQQKLAEHFIELTKDKHSTVVVSQSWSEIHKVNEQVRDDLKAQGLVGRDETTVTALERLDLTDAQKRDKRFYDKNAVLVFNRPINGFKPGDTGRMRAITDKHILIESNNRIRPVAVKELDRITVCQPKELSLSSGDRLQLKANRQSWDGRRLANGELVTVKELHADGRIALDDGRVLPKDYRQFVRGYAVTSYAAQGKTVDYVLFSDSAVKAATNEQQWYVTTSRGRKGIRIFTADKIQLRQNVARSGDRTLALDIAKPKESFAHRLARIWKRDIAYVFDVGRSQRESALRQAEIIQQSEAIQESKKPETIRQPQTVRQARTIAPKQNQTKTYRRGIGV
jgi:conjugative relaxase-like TrwC/TraI family protein